MENKIFVISKKDRQQADINGSICVWYTCNMYEKTDGKYPEILCVTLSESDFKRLSVGDEIAIKQLRFTCKGSKGSNGITYYRNTIRLVDYELVASPQAGLKQMLANATGNASTTTTDSSYEPLSD